MILTYSNTSYAVYEAGIYGARLAKWEDAGIGGAYNKPQVKLYWQFLDDDGRVTETELPTWVNVSFGPKSTLTAIAAALLKTAQFPVNFELDMDDLIGKDCYLTLTVTPKVDGSGDRNSVLAYTPFGTRGAPVARRAPVAAGVGATEPPF